MDVKITQQNVLTVKASDVGLIIPSTQNPFVLRKDTGVIGGVNDIFSLTPPNPGDILVFDPATSKYKNVTLSGTATVNSTGVASLTGIRNRTKVVASLSTPTPNFTTEDKLFILALATDATFGAPTGTFEDGSLILYRVKDNGISRNLLWNSIFRGSFILPLPTITTAGKTMNIGVIYNAADVKWDLIALLDGF